MTSVPTPWPPPPTPVRTRVPLTPAAGSVTTVQLSEQILKYLKPEITAQPQATNVYSDTNHTFSVSAEGKYLTYQWKKNGADLPGETNATLVLTDANASLHDGNYSVVVSNDFGSAESGEVQLSFLNKRMDWSVGGSSTRPMGRWLSTQAEMEMMEMLPMDRLGRQGKSEVR